MGINDLLCGPQSEANIGLRLRCKEAVKEHGYMLSGDTTPGISDHKVQSSIRLRHTKIQGPFVTNRIEGIRNQIGNYLFKLTRTCVDRETGSTILQHLRVNGYDLI